MNPSLLPSLYPTMLQMHHPWIGICSVQAIRGRTAVDEDRYDDEEPCHNFFGDDDGERLGKDCKSREKLGGRWREISEAIAQKRT
jgi:hypothetical protein